MGRREWEAGKKGNVLLADRTWEPKPKFPKNSILLKAHLLGLNRCALETVFYVLPVGEPVKSQVDSGSLPKGTGGLRPMCCACSVLSDCATSWTVGSQAPLSMGFSRQEYWSGLLCPAPGDLPNPVIDPRSPAGGFFTVWVTKKTYVNVTTSEDKQKMLSFENKLTFRMPITEGGCPHVT